MKKILLLHTGGTLGMDLGGAPLDAGRFRESLAEFVPQVFKLADIDIVILFSKDSSNMTPRDWVEIASRLNEKMADYDAFVITHGTDTMAFTASALSFMLEGINKPVILTGSQRPLKDVRSDAPRNILNSIQIAVDGRVREVCIFFDSLLLRGNRAKKTSIPSFKAFESPNCEPLAVVGSQTDYLASYEPPIANYCFDPRIETRVVSLPVFPGLDTELYLGLLDKGIKGLVIQAFGPGDIPLEEQSIVQFIRRLKSKGIPTVVCSQAITGRVDLSLYETGRAARDAGAVSAQDMTWECVVVKMMVLLGRGLSGETFDREITRNLCGELYDDRSARP